MRQIMYTVYCIHAWKFGKQNTLENTKFNEGLLIKIRHHAAKCNWLCCPSTGSNSADCFNLRALISKSAVCQLQEPLIAMPRRDNQANILMNFSLCQYGEKKVCAELLGQCCLPTMLFARIA